MITVKIEDVGETGGKRRIGFSGDSTSDIETIKLAWNISMKEIAATELEKSSFKKQAVYVNGSQIERDEFVRTIEIYDDVKDDFEYFKKVIFKICSEIMSLSMVGKTNQYSNKGNIVLLNKTLFSNNVLSASEKIFNHKLKQNDEFEFIQVAPYASFLERHGVSSEKRRTNFKKSADKWRRHTGLKNRTGESNMVRRPSGVYFTVAARIKNLTKRQIKISNGFENGASLSLDSFSFFQKGGSKMRRSFVGGSKWTGAYVYPFIRVKYFGASEGGKHEQQNGEG